MFSRIAGRIKDSLGVPWKRRLLENFISLTTLQGINCILPLITVPYLVRVLGPEKFGLISFAQALITYFVILTDYGFNLSATRKVSIYREDKNKIAKIFSAVILIKFAFMLTSFLGLTILVYALPRLRSDWSVYFSTFGIVLGNMLFPVWFFQGMENMKYITLLTILARTVFTLSIFIFIRHQENYTYVPILNSSGTIAASLLGLWFVRKNFNIRFTIPNFNSIIEELMDGWHIFISSLANSLYTISTPFILGLFTNNTIVGYYSAGERIIAPFVNLTSPFSQTIFPHISKIANVSKEKTLEFLGHLCIPAGFLILIFCSGLFVFADKITLTILGRQYYESILIVKIISFYPLVIFLSNIFGTQIMISFNLLAARTRVIVSCGIVHLIILLSLVPFYRHIGAAIALITTQTFAATGLLLSILKYKNTTQVELTANEA